MKRRSADLWMVGVVGSSIALSAYLFFPVYDYIERHPISSLRYFLSYLSLDERASDPYVNQELAASFLFVLFYALDYAIYAKFLKPRISEFEPNQEMKRARSTIFYRGKWQVICVVVYAVLYLLCWTISLGSENMRKLLLPFAIAWISSAFVCLRLSKTRKQVALFSLFAGSIFGPLGILMVLLSDKDIRALSEGEKDIKFYEGLFFELDRLYKGIVEYEKTESNFLRAFFMEDQQINGKLAYFASYFGIRLGTQWTGQRQIPAIDLMKDLQKILTEFDKEYRKKFGSEFRPIRNVLPDIEKDIERWSFL